jgi:hypothetical protein
MFLEFLLGMGDPIEFRGKSGYLNLAIRPESRKDIERVVEFGLSLESIDDLRTLLNMASNEMVTVGDERMPYSKFRSEVLERTHRIYLKDGRLLDMVS